MSDIYVKGWMSGIEDDVQKTDIHYRFVKSIVPLSHKLCFYLKLAQWMVKGTLIGVLSMTFYIYQLNDVFQLKRKNIFGVMMQLN